MFIHILFKILNVQFGRNSEIISPLARAPPPVRGGGREIENLLCELSSLKNFPFFV